MNVQQIYTGCLAHAAYYVESGGEAAIFDPLRDVGPYIERARRDGAVIKYVFETHFHADFVSGHVELARRTGATIIYGPTAKPGFPAHVAADGEVFRLGAAQVKAIHTPGHTLESTTYLLIDEEGREHGIITGDTLFIGDVGRPDLAQHVDAELTADKLAGLLYDSLRERIMPLSDDLVVYPNHGAGSACGKNMARETMSTLGEQKRTNYALRPGMTKAEFKRAVLAGLLPPPAYFPDAVVMNMMGCADLEHVLARGLQPLSPEEFEASVNRERAFVLDSRPPSSFAQGHVPNSINIGLNGDFALWAGTLMDDIRRPILLVTGPGQEEETIIRLGRIGHDRILGYLQGGVDAWQASGRALRKVFRIPAEEFADRYRFAPFVVDVRDPKEFEHEHVLGAINVPLSGMQQHLVAFPQDRPFILYCGGGYRSMIAASLLLQRGWEDLMDVDTGFTGIKEAGVSCIHGAAHQQTCPPTDERQHEH